MSIKLMTAAWDCPLPPTEKMVLLCFCDFANDEGDCWPSIAAMVKKTSLSERTIQRAIKRLVDAKIVSQKTRAGTSTNYRIHPRHFDTPVTVTPRHSDTPPPSLCHPTPVTVTPHPRHSDTQTIIEPSRTPKEPKGDLRPENVSDELWADFLKVRAAKKAPVTRTALRGIEREAAKVGWSLPDAIEKIVERNWQGFSADWVTPKVGGQGYVPTC